MTLERLADMEEVKKQAKNEASGETGQGCAVTGTCREKSQALGLTPTRGLLWPAEEAWAFREAEHEIRHCRSSLP